ncbi:hypothetical protein [Nocardia huaxiensis]|uniref:hypothetical protein n=1 Tax=Nocardia huaxiensis TaxID=2755382 RepID=UPI001E61FDB6|nr:hypothetical protein [Nocardia huaxiensis]UFS98218.1 hypothetical protein LPY97_10140 [Nocardia huaxiensis]
MNHNGNRWLVPSGRRVAPLLRLPLQPEMAGNLLSLARRPWSLAAACAGVAGGAYLQPGGMRLSHREIIIARTAWNIGGYFPYAAHNPTAALAARRYGGQEAIQNGPADPRWRPREAVLLRIVDELQQEFDLSERTRAAAANHFTPSQIMNIAAQTGLYETVTMTFDSMGFIPSRTMWRWVRGGESAPIAQMTTRGAGETRPRPRDSEPTRSGPPWLLTDPDLRARVAAAHPLLARLAPIGTRVASWTSALSPADATRVMRRLDAAFEGKPTTAETCSRRIELLHELVGDLHTHRFIPDETWSAATEFFTDRELIDLCALTGTYRTQHLIARAAPEPLSRNRR